MLGRSWKEIKEFFAEGRRRQKERRDVKGNMARWLAMMLAIEFKKCPVEVGRWQCQDEECHCSQATQTEIQHCWEKAAREMVTK